MQKSQEETKKSMVNMQKCQDMRNTLEKKTDSVKEKIAAKMDENIGRVEDLEKKLLPCENKNESKVVPAFPVPVHVTASSVPVKLSTYDGKINWVVYKTQFSIISEANG
ncbi:hypothetical protein TNCV_549101 [Trichonephila clavipes]|nr:hypothetical protein TNCV_549101 [Trichonephila clavipes]